MASMAELVLLITGKDQASKVLNGVKDSAGGLGGALKNVGTIASGFLAAGAIQQGAGALVGFLQSATKAALEDAASTARLQKAVENTGASYGAYSKALDQVISKGQKLAFTDDQTRDSMSLLIAQTGSVEEATKRYALAQDLARGANIDVVTASKLLGKVTEENVNVLARYGISMKEGASETELFGAIQAKFGGQAATFADTTAGKWQQAQIRFGEMKEALGAQLLPVMTKVMDFLVAVAIPAMERFIQKIGPDVQRVVGDVVAFIQTNWPTISAVIGFALDFVQAKVEGVIQVIGGIIEVVTSVVNLVSALVHGDWSRAWQEMKDIAEATIDIFIGNLKWMFGSIPGIIADLSSDLFNAGVGLANDIIDGIKRALSNFTLKLEIGRVEKLGVEVFPGVSMSVRPFSFLKEGHPFIPFDNFPAMLHRGERVLTAEENRNFGSAPTIVNVYLDGELISSSVERRQSRSLQLAGLGVA